MMDLAARKQWLIDAYFSDPGRRLQLRRGDTLMKEGEPNERLYWLKSGTLLGYSREPDGSLTEDFHSSSGSFVGVPSFFSRSFQTIATVVAETDCELYFIERNQETIPERESGNLHEQFMPLVVSLLVERQQQLQVMARNTEEALTAMKEMEKLASLGQLSAGVAHELNNAITVIARGAGTIETAVQRLVDGLDEASRQAFETGSSFGRVIPSRDVRKQGKEIAARTGISRSAAEKLARIGLDQPPPEGGRKEKEEAIERIHAVWELGATLFDMRLAARQSEHVVQSMRSLGVQDAMLEPDVDVTTTISEALALSRNALIGIEVTRAEENGLKVTANRGQLIQVWTNLLRNAAEAIKTRRVPDAKIRIAATGREDFLEVRIEDNGPGIPAALLNSIFLPNVTTKKKGLAFGLGVGLTIVERIVKEHGGTITVESAAGKGTLFVVRFPRGG